MCTKPAISVHICLRRVYIVPRLFGATRSENYRRIPHTYRCHALKNRFPDNGYTNTVTFAALPWRVGKRLRPAGERRKRPETVFRARRRESRIAAMHVARLLKRSDNRVGAIVLSTPLPGNTSGRNG